jgi:F-type H+-transporting ATPase subunit b
MFTLKSMMKRLAFVAVVVIAVMGFGIGNKFAAAATTTTNASQLQPAGGAEDFHAADGSATDGKHATQDGAAAEHTEDAGIVGMFGLDWKLFLAQLINFGIILFVLWKWVFGPVTKGLAQRTEKIESSLAEAQRIAEERETFDSWKQGEISTVRTEAAAILTQAKRDAENLRSEMVEQTKLEQEKVMAAAQAKLEAEKQSMLESAKGELADLVVKATETIIRRKLDPKKDAELINEALKQASSQGGRE